MNEKVREYLGRLDALYAEIRSWVADADIRCERGSVQLNEERGGKYSAPKLLLLGKGGASVAELDPIGAYIIGAAGRVDLRGALDTVPILYLLAGGPVFQTRTSAGGAAIDEQVRPVFHGVTQEGWYTVADKQPRSARQLGRETFRDILRQVSDYGAP